MEYATRSNRKDKKVAVAFALAVCLLALPAFGAGSASQAAGSSQFVASSAAEVGQQHPVLTFTPGIVTTTAGTGESGYSGDGGPAVSAKFNSPVSVLRDNVGNLYIADIGNNVVRKIDLDGNISTVAGNGTQGYSGDGGLATAAQLAWPWGVAVDSAGNIYIADFLNFCVRKVDANGIISTVATSGSPVRSVTVDDPGNVYFSGWPEGVWKVDTQGVTTRVAGNGTQGFSGDGGPATNAQISGVSGLALDPLGQLYLAELLNSDVRKVDLGGVISTAAGDQQGGFAGDGGPANKARFNGPADIRFDAAGSFYIADSSNNRIRKVNALGVINTIAGDGNYGYSGDSGVASQAQFAGPVSVALDESGNQFIADIGNNVIRKLSVDSTTLDFGTVTVGQVGGPITVVVSNAGNADMHVGSIGTTGDFVTDSTCSQTDVLAPGRDCSIAVTFVPTISGPIIGTVTVTDDAPGSPHLIHLRGQGYVVPVASQLMFANAFPTRQLNSNLGTVTVNATDSSGNLATGFNGSVTLQLQGPAGFSTYSTQSNAANGTVAFNLSAVSLTVAGTYTITASSNGLTSAQTTFTVTGNPDFAISLSKPSMTLGRSSRGSVNVTVAPSNGFKGTVTLTCSALPANSSCSFVPISLQADGSNAQLTSVLTVSTGVTSAAAIRNSGDVTYFVLGSGTMSLGLVGLALFPRLRRGTPADTRLRIFELILLLVILCGGLVGCGTLGGNGGQDNSTPPGTYHITVTGSSAGVSHSTVLDLVVE